MRVDWTTVVQALIIVAGVIAVVMITYFIKR